MIQPTPRRAVFLDRDGVLNRAVVRDGKPYPPSSPADVQVLPGVSKALHVLKSHGVLLIVVTNQPDVARGTQRRDIVEAIHKTLAERLPLDDILVCYHDDADACSCRKPLPGLLLSASERYGIDLSMSFMVGDRWRDIEAGQRAGCKTIFIDYGYAEKGPPSPPDLTTQSLFDATSWILQQSNDQEIL